MNILSYLDGEHHFRKKDNQINSLGMTNKEFSDFLTKWREKNLRYKKVYIFDIDNCIMPNVFPNLNEKGSIEEIRRKLKAISLYPEFIEYFKKITNAPGIKIFFLTGRKSKDFRIETINQLKLLDITEEHIIFYPKEYSYSKIRYFVFKIYNILKIAIMNNKYLEVVVFDDKKEYFEKLLKKAEQLNIRKLKLNFVFDSENYW